MRVKHMYSLCCWVKRSLPKACPQPRAAVQGRTRVALARSWRACCTATVPLAFECILVLASLRIGKREDLWLLHATLEPSYFPLHFGG